MFGWEFPPHNSGGLGVACQGLLRALSRKGAEVTFVLPKRLPLNVAHSQFVFAENWQSITGHAINSSLSPYLTEKTYASRSDHGIYGTTLLEEVRRYGVFARRLAKSVDYDVIYGHDWLSFEAGIAVKKDSGKPFIAHVHATEFDRCGGAASVNRDTYTIEYHGMEVADRVVAVSKRTKQVIVKEYDVPTRKVRVIYNGIDEDTPFQPASTDRLKALKKTGNAIILFVGRITVQKGLDYFIRAARRVLDVNPHVTFVVSGSGDMERSMIELVASLGIMKNFFFTGFLRNEDLHEVFALADLFVMPSVSEPFGLVALEAIQKGTPVLLSRQSGVSEILKHALKVDFWDVEDMANKIVSIVQYPSLSHAIVSHASQEVKGLTWGRAADQVMHLANELHSRQRV